MRAKEAPSSVARILALVTVTESFGGSESAGLGSAESDLRLCYHVLTAFTVYLTRYYSKIHRCWIISGQPQVFARPHWKHFKAFKTFLWKELGLYAGTYLFFQQAQWII